MADRSYLDRLKDEAADMFEIGDVGVYGASHLKPSSAEDMARFQVNQAIEKHGGIRFNYAPQATDAAGRVNWLPFYENPLIVESRRANYANAKVFLRNEPVRLYTGSEARKFKIDIHYTLAHIASMVPTNALLQMFSTDSTLSDEELSAIDTYLRAVVAQDTGTVPYDDQIRSQKQNQLKRGNQQELGPNELRGANLESMKNRLADGSEGPVGKFFDEGDPLSRWNSMLEHILQTSDSWTQISKIVMYAVNLIRGSVIASKGYPVKGPPIVELKWGALYNFVPCIVTDYRLQPLEEAGYDVKSLMSQRLKISLSLEEMRNIHGNLHGDPQVTSDLPGWDSILELGTMDPEFIGDQGEEF